jgi:hypothetical protein
MGICLHVKYRELDCMLMNYRPLDIDKLDDAGKRRRYQERSMNVSCMRLAAKLL